MPAAMEQVTFMLGGAVMMTIAPMLAALSLNSEGKYDYSVVSAVFFSEMGKLVLSSAFLYVEVAAAGGVKGNNPRFAMNAASFKSLLLYAVPAAIYFVNNLLSVYALQYISVTDNQVLSQLKIVCTAVLFRVIMGKELSAYQWISILQLTCGCATSQLPSAGAAAPSQQQHDSSMLGAMMTLASCGLSSLAGIYSEQLLKGSSDSIHWQNIQLYSWGVVFNLAGMFVQDSAEISQKGLLGGYNGFTVAYVVSTALNGLVISAILKYADNIVRVYAHSLAMVVTMVLYTIFFHHPPTVQLLLGLVMVVTSMVQYNMKVEPAPASSSSEQAPTGPSPEERLIEPQHRGAEEDWTTSERRKRPLVMEQMNVW